MNNDILQSYQMMTSSILIINYCTRIKFRGLNFCVLDGKKICGVLVFVAMAVW